MALLSSLRRPSLILLLWSIVILELVSPVPAVLTLGAAYVLLRRPRWFPELVRRIYEAPDAAEGDP